MIYEKCDRCDNDPGQLVEHFATGKREALCFTCWHPLSSVGTGEVKVLNWINKHGKLQFRR